ncbi:MAG: metal-dependent transcriptional regulator [Acidobacteria bacterium]|nr:metal-dependent transcriptional regulator [Acidobacteriota bacterium]
MSHPMNAAQQLEEMAEEIWALDERGMHLRSRLVEGSKLGQELAAATLKEMSRQELIRETDDEVHLLPAGESLARTVIRRHRLAEVLFRQVLAVGEEDTEITACQVEHILSEEVTDRICTYLGHPPTCPHGKAIPRGDCCAVFRRDVTPLVQPLSALSIGSRARIVFIAQALHSRMDRLLTLGIQAGGVIRLQQNHPSVVVQVGETSVALDREICNEIFVLPLEK